MATKNAKNGSEPEPKEVEHGGRVIADQILILLISKADGIMTRHSSRSVGKDNLYMASVAFLGRMDRPMTLGG